MDTEEHGEGEETAEAAAGEDTQEDTKVSGGGTDEGGEDAAKSSEEAPAAEDAEGKQDAADIKEAEESEQQDKPELGSSEKDAETAEASTEAKAEETIAEEGGGKDAEDKGLGPDASEEVHTAKTGEGATGGKEKDEAQAKAKPGKKEGKAGKGKKLAADTEATESPKKPEKGQKGGKKKGKKEAETEKKSEPSTEVGEGEKPIEDQKVEEQEEVKADTEATEPPKKPEKGQKGGKKKGKKEAETEKKSEPSTEAGEGEKPLEDQKVEEQEEVKADTEATEPPKKPEKGQKGGKKKGKKEAKTEKISEPSTEAGEGETPIEDQQVEEQEEVEAEEGTAQETPPAKVEQEERPSKVRISKRKSAKSEGKLAEPSVKRRTTIREPGAEKHVSMVEGDETKRLSSRASSGRRSTRRERRSRLSRRTRITVVEEAPKPKEDPFDIEGVVHLVIRPELQAKLGCEIGKQVTTEAPWIVVRKRPIDIDLRKATSDFASVCDEVKAYTGKEILVGYHVASDIPNTFYVCLTEAAKTQIEETLKAIEIDRLERVEKMLERYAGEWQSLGSGDEIDSWKIVLARPLIEVDVQVSTSIERKRVFEDCDADVENSRYIRIGPARVPPTNILKSRIDEAVQACPEKVLAYAQTYLPFPRNIWTQYLYEISESDTALTPDITAKLKEFLGNSYDMMEPVISYNAHFDLYRDDYVGLVQSERDLAKSKEILYKSYNIFFDVARCKDKMITAVDWHPMWSGIVAIGYADKLRSLCTGKQEQDVEFKYTILGSSAVLIWSFVDEISPKLILECPHEIHALRFCPHDENLLIGGCANGQVVLWDLTDKLWNVEYEEILTDEQKCYRINLNKNMTWMKKTSFPNIVRISVWSCLDFSPQACITDVRWLSPYAELSRLGRYKVLGEEQKSLQFATSAEDGTICIWDLQTELKGGPVKAHKKKRHVPEDLTAGLSKYRSLNLIFSPIFKVKVKEGMETGIIRLTFMESDFFPLTYNLRTPLVPNKEYTLSDRLLYAVSFQQPEKLPRPHLFLGTMEGQALHISWAGYETETGEAITSENCKYSSFNDNVHGAPITSVSRSTFIPDLVLTVSARVFAIWREDFKNEPLLWRRSAIRMACGRWSLYRPSSFLICNYDGSITTWDLLLRSNNHVKEQTVSGKVITAAYPTRREPYQHIMTLADFMGGFRAFLVPTAYMEYDKEDENAIRHFFTRELDARNAFREWEKTWWEKNAYILEEEEAAREEQERRLRLEAEKREKDEAKRALEEEAKKKKQTKKETQASWTERYQQKWEEFQESNMMKVIMSLKHFRKSELLSKLQPLEALHEEEEKKKHKHKDRLDQAQKLFEDLIFLLFPGTLEPPQSVHRSAEALFSRLEEIPDQLLEIYQDLEKKSLSYIEEHEFSYEFSWRTVLNEGLASRRALDENVCPRAGRDARYKTEKQWFSQAPKGAEGMEELSGRVAEASEQDEEGEEDTRLDEQASEEGAETVAPALEEGAEEKPEASEVGAPPPEDESEAPE